MWTEEKKTPIQISSTKGKASTPYFFLKECFFISNESRDYNTLATTVLVHNLQHVINDKKIENQKDRKNLKGRLSSNSILDTIVIALLKYFVFYN